ncbi:choline dehydrogenase [Dendryphion nanum]|uniref:Choline dehydrogenase n=1 Tax=Dendryphion nanum TaxID=256645 RepID=A0A9P9DBH3_9PLEO|nr:choline dehydrogenase [Dendryphion nanum]
MADTFDFIIVGAGTAGSLLAHRLSHAPARPSVLLVEAGSNPDGEYLRAPFHRYTPAFLRPDLDHGYVSTPQKELNDRVIPYNRGKGLGGSSILNFQVYLYGSEEDYNYWAEVVGDENWRWEHTKKSFHAIENYDFSGAEKYEHLAKPDLKEHGSEGQVKVSLPPELEKGFASGMEALIKSGEKINLDANSGDPMGISIFPASASADGRTTSAIAHLVDPPKNLTIWTGATVSRLELSGTKVTGIETTDGRKASSQKEVIIASGTIDTPRLLLLNGIGPEEELKNLGIPVVKDLPGVGKQLHDHVMTFLCAEVDDTQNDRYAWESDTNMVMEADALWKKDRTGKFSLVHSGLWGGFLKHPELENISEYKELDKATQEFLAREKVPTYEFIGPSILLPPGAQLSKGSSYLTFVAILMNAQSKGSVTLQSSDPVDKPVIELNYLSHPYDKRMMRETVRQSWTKIYENPDIKPLVKKTLHGPATLSDEDIDAFVKEAASTVWHANGTAMMGQSSNPLAVVDSKFRVFGVDGLRIADLSVCPLTTNNHSQATAYLVGQKAAETLIAEYQLGAAKADTP